MIEGFELILMHRGFRNRERRIQIETNALTVRITDTSSIIEIDARIEKMMTTMPRHILVLQNEECPKNITFQDHFAFYHPAISFKRQDARRRTTPSNARFLRREQARRSSRASTTSAPQRVLCRNSAAPTSFLSTSMA